MHKQSLATLNAVYEHIKTHNKIPSMAEIMATVGKKKGAVRGNLWTLHKAGKLVFDGRQIKKCTVIKASDTMESGTNWFSVKLVNNHV